ncbi:Plasmodium exported protein, unknown function [Plasmodium malariae]|uniref:Pv-fam-d protein n=1 Tax=Plasmodium malariae TaxID=5858 RepID=A0A1A8X1S1_PLAMA|nr:Plasmodium exported protein, unknown function [Plasmodium malariae]
MIEVTNKLVSLAVNLISFGNSWNKEVCQSYILNTRTFRLLKGDTELFGVNRNTNMKINELDMNNNNENSFRKEFDSIINGKNLPKKYNLLLNGKYQNYFDSFESIPEVLTINSDLKKDLYDSNDSLDQYASIDYLPADNNNKKQQEEKKKFSKLSNNGILNNHKNSEINEFSENEISRDEYSPYEDENLPYEQRVAKLEKLESIALENEKSKSGFLNYIKNLDKNIELGIYRALKSDYRGNNFKPQKMSTTKKILRFINHYKVFAPIVINIIMTFVMGCLNYSTTQFVLFGGTILMLFYLLNKLIKLDSMRLTFREHMRSQQ